MVNARRLLLPLTVALASACSDPTPATPQAAVTFQIKPGTGGAVACSTNKAVYWSIGSGAGGDVPVKDGDTQSGATVGVQCKVAGNDQSGYDVTAQATLAGKGTVAVQGHLLPTSDAQPNITGVFTDGTGLGTFRETDCTVTFVAGTNEGIAGGRVWGTILCPNATDSKQGKTCEGDSQFRFENCSQ